MNDDFGKIPDDESCRAMLEAFRTAQSAVPVAWVRFCSDGSFEGPIMDSDPRMDGVRRTCGAWTPLYTHPAAAQPARAAVPFDLLAHLQRQREFSERTFGPGKRTKGVVDHIRKELGEVEANPDDLTEWADVVILALDGFWRAGATPQQIVQTIVAKQTKNENRKWPDWRTMPTDKAIEHDRAHDEQVQK